MTEIFTPIDHSRTADEVVQQIEGLIVEGVLRPGDRLPGERDLARQFGVSRPILRDALRTLDLSGLVVTRAGGGTAVADIIGQVFSDPVARLIANHRKAWVDYLEYRRETEGMAADYAARRVTADDRLLLDAIMRRMADAHEKADFADEGSIDVEFHQAIGECAHNIVLLHTLRACYRLLSEGVFRNRLLVFTLPGARNQLYEQHQAIHAAVARGEPAAARRAAMDHISYIEVAMTEAERSGEWQRVARLRLMQRGGETFKPASQRAGEGFAS